MHHWDEIRSIAYQIWEEEGYPEGRDVEHWLRAEMIWQERNQPVAAAAPVKAVAGKPRVKRKPPQKRSRVARQ